MTIKSIIAKIQEYQSFVVTGHDPADADCVGSCLTLVKMLKILNKKAYHVRSCKVPGNCQFLPSVADTFVLPNWQSKKIDCLIVVDSPDKFRIDNVLSLFVGIPIVVIDHHQYNRIESQISWVDKSKSSTSEMLCELAQEMNIPLDLDMAMCLYAGMASDTGFFHYANTTPKTMLWASQLMSVGIDTDYIYRQLTCFLTPSELSCCTEMIANVQYYDDVAVCILKKEMLRRYKLRAISMQYIHEIILTVATTKVSITAQELEPSLTKIGLRSKDTPNVADIAKIFDGGGHINAAGCTIQEPFKKAVSNVLLALGNRSL